MAEKVLQDLFVAQLRDILYAEKHIVKALPKMAKKAQSTELQTAFLDHAEMSKTHVDRLEKIFEMQGLTAKGKTCEAIEGLLTEGDELSKDFAGSDALDAALISAAQKVEHYEMATYGCLRTWAKLLGHTEAAALLQETLDEEGATDEALTALAESGINAEAQVAE